MLKERLATQDDFLALGGPLQRTARACAYERPDGKLAAVAGHYLQDGAVVVFSNIHPETRKMRSFPRDCLRIGREIVREAQQWGLPVLAAAGGESPFSARLLEHLGFQQAYQEIHVWHGHR